MFGFHFVNEVWNEAWSTKTKKYSCNKNVTFLSIWFPASYDPSIHFPQHYICFFAQTYGPGVDFSAMEKPVI